VLISEIESRQKDGCQRVEAIVTWEEGDRPSLRLFFEVDEAHAGMLSAEPNAFLVMGVLPAWHQGERRLRVQGPVCPMLKDQIVAPLRTLASWYPDLGDPPAIESAAGTKARPAIGSGAMEYLSCGVDSMATLRANRLWYEKGHPLSIRACVLADWMGRDPDEPSGYTSNPDAGKLASTSRVCDAADADLITLRTNLWYLDGDGYFFTNKAFGAYYAGMAHLFDRTFSTSYTAASMDATAPFPVGSHPMLDPYYGSSSLRIEHHGTYMSRFERTRLIAGWQAALDYLNVCQNDCRGEGNCGTCEKCIRTKVALVALGKLGDASAFEEDDVDTELLETVIEYDMVHSIWVANYWRDMIEPLRGAGRDDLVAVVERIAANFKE
jgi:hypothetical protein